MRIYKNQTGISLIEMMISLAILAIGLLALAATQSRSMMMNQSAYYRSVAADLAADLADRIRANRTPFMASADLGVQALKPPDFSKCTTSSCPKTGADRVKYHESDEMKEWEKMVSNLLPNGTATITATTPTTPPDAAQLGLLRYEVSIEWADDRTKSDVDKKIFKYVTVIE